MYYQQGNSLKKWRRIRAVNIVLVVLLFCLFGTAVNGMAESSSDFMVFQQDDEVQDAKDYVPGEILVIYKADTLVSRQEKPEEAYYVQSDENRFILDEDDTGYDAQAQIIVVDVGEEEAAIVEYMQNPEVLYAQPNYLYYCSAVVPTDPAYATKQKVNMQLIKAEDGWSITKGTSTVTIAVIDTGINLKHEDLIGTWDKQANTINADITVDDSSVSDVYGHGSHVAGIIVAQMNNGKGIAGIAPACRVMPIKAGVAGYSSVSLERAIRYAVDNGADVINLSIGGKNFDQLLFDACNYAETKGVVIVASTGNDNQDTHEYPASYPTVIGVTAVDSSGNKMPFNYNTSVKLAAPGKAIYSAYYTTASSYVTADGTSMATPVVAGICGLIIGKNPGITPDEVRQILYSTAQDRGDKGYDVHYGYGIVNMYAALMAKPEKSDSFEPNNGYSQAAQLALGTEIGAKLSYADDSDVYTFSIEDESEVTVCITAPKDLAIFEPYLVSKDSDAPQELFTVQLMKSEALKTIYPGNTYEQSFELSPGTYYVSLSAAERGTFSNEEYKLTINSKETKTRTLYGDIFADGVIDSKDLTLLSQYLASWPLELLTDFNFEAADTFADGVIDTKDAVKLAQYLANWTVVLGVND